MDAPTVQSPTGRQYSCANCNDRLFYVMLQPDGNVEVFCHLHNHRQILVNIPKLIEAAFGLDSKDESENGNDNADRIGDPSFNG